MSAALLEEPSAEAAFDVRFEEAQSQWSDVQLLRRCNLFCVLLIMSRMMLLMLVELQPRALWYGCSYDVFQSHH